MERIWKNPNQSERIRENPTNFEEPLESERNRKNLKSDKLFVNPKESHRIRKNPKNFSESEYEKSAEGYEKIRRNARRTGKILEDPKESLWKNMRESDGSQKDPRKC